MAEDFQREVRFLGILSSPSFVRQPEGNGVAERAIRTLKEQLLWVRHFATVEDLRQALAEVPVKARLTALGTDPAPPESVTPEALRAHLIAEVQRWAPLIRAAGIYAN